MSPIWILKGAVFLAERLVTAFLLFASSPLFQSGMAEYSEQKFCFANPFLLCELTQLRLGEGMVLALDPGWTNMLQRNSPLQKMLVSSLWLMTALGRSLGWETERCGDRVRMLLPSNELHLSVFGGGVLLLDSLSRLQWRGDNSLANLEVGWVSSAFLVTKVEPTLCSTLVGHTASGRARLSSSSHFLLMTALRGKGGYHSSHPRRLNCELIKR